MAPEKIVVTAVEDYFSQPKFQKFSIKKEDRIQFGSRLGFADIVLINNKGKRAAIVECKQIGIEGYGPAQLKSYLCATDTLFGIFANSTEPDEWQFYENLGQNQFKENLTRSEFEDRVVKNENNLITRVSDFFRQISQLQPDESTQVKSVKPDGKTIETEMNRKPSTIIQDRPLQNGNREDTTIKPDLNGKPYYSEQNGFYWAANHQGNAECVPQHIKRIIHNEEVEIATTRDEIDKEMNLSRQNVAELEGQKHGYEQGIEERTQEIAQKKEELAGLQVQFNALAKTDPEMSPIEITPDDSNYELNTPVVEDILGNSTIQQRSEEIGRLIEEKTNLEQAIDGKAQTLADKNKKLAELDTQRHALTQTDPETIPETFLEEIDQFGGEKSELEGQKREYDQGIEERTQEIAQKKEELAELQAQFNALTEIEPKTLSDIFVEETWIGRWKQRWRQHSESETASTHPSPNDPVPEFVEESPDDSRKQQLDAEIKELIDSKDTLQQEIKQKNEVLARTQEDLAGLEAGLEAPTEIELNQPSEAASQVNIKKRFSWPSRIISCIPSMIVPSIAALVLILLTFYLFIFYASAIDKAIFLNEEEIAKQIDEGTYSSGIRSLVDPQALVKAAQNQNYLVLFGPVLFVAFALAVDLLWKPDRKRASILFAVLTFILDILLAIHISQKIHLAETEIQIWAPENSNIEGWKLFGSGTMFEVLTVIFFGFVASLLASVLHHVTREQWKQVTPNLFKSKEDVRHEIYRQAEKTKRNAQIAVVNTEINNLKNEINQLTEDMVTMEQKISDRQTKVEAFSRQQQEAKTKAMRVPIETQIAVVNAEIDSLQNEINRLTEKMAATELEIEKLSKQQRAAELEATKIPIETQIAVVNAEIDSLQNEINRLTEKMAATELEIEKLSKQQRAAELEATKIPIETQIAVVNAEIDSLQNEINRLTEKHTALEKKIKSEEEKIGELLHQRKKRVIHLSKLQSQVHQFLNGWQRFIIHSADEETDVSDQIDEVKQIAEDTLNQYYQNSPDYVSQA